MSLNQTANTTPANVAAPRPALPRASRNEAPKGAPRYGARGRSQSRGGNAFVARRLQEDQRSDLLKAAFINKPDLDFMSSSTDTKVSIKLEALVKSDLVNTVVNAVLDGGLVTLEKSKDGKPVYINLPAKQLPPQLHGEVIRCVMTHLTAATSAAIIGQLVSDVEDYGNGDYGEAPVTRKQDLKSELEYLRGRYSVKDLTTKFEPMTKKAFVASFGVPISKE